MTLRQRALFVALFFLVISFTQFSLAGTLLHGSYASDAPANASVAIANGG